MSLFPSHSPHHSSPFSIKVKSEKRASLLGESVNIRLTLKNQARSKSRPRKSTQGNIVQPMNDILHRSTTKEKTPFENFCLFAIVSSYPSFSHFIRPDVHFIITIIFLVLFSRCRILCVVVVLVWTDILQPPLWLASSPLFPVSILSNPFPFPARLCASYRLGGGLRGR